MQSLYCTKTVIQMSFWEHLLQHSSSEGRALCDLIAWNRCAPNFFVLTGKKVLVGWFQAINIFLAHFPGTGCRRLRRFWQHAHRTSSSVASASDASDAFVAGASVAGIGVSPLAAADCTLGLDIISCFTTRLQSRGGFEADDAGVPLRVGLLASTATAAAALTIASRTGGEQVFAPF